MKLVDDNAAVSKSEQSIRKKRAGSEGELSPGLHSLSGGFGGALAVMVEDYIIHSGFDCTVSDISTDRSGDFVPASVGHNPI
jgi:hypothetical protein